MPKLKMKRVAPGIYDATVGDRTFEIEQVADGTWQLVETTRIHRDYMNHFMTLHRAKLAVVKETGATVF